MSIFITVLIVILSVIILLLIVALLLKKDYAIKRIIVINAPQYEVFALIRLLKEQRRYNVWVMKDPNVKLEYIGTDGEVGAINRWEGNKDAGKGEQEIIGLTDNSIKLELRFEKPFKALGQSEISALAKNASETQVYWLMTGRSPYPMNLMTTVMAGVLAKDLDKSLKNLKSILEP